MFKLLGGLVAVYVAYCLHSGEVYAKSGIFGRTIVRDESPGRYWSTIIVYSLLALALLLVF